MAAMSSTVDRARRSVSAAAKPASASAGNIQPVALGTGHVTPPLVRTIEIHPSRPAEYTAATQTIGAVPSASAVNRSVLESDSRLTTSAPKVRSSGPIQIGQVRNAAVPPSAAI